MVTPLVGLFLAVALGGSDSAPTTPSAPSPGATTAPRQAPAITPERQARIEKLLTLLGVKPRIELANQHAREDLHAYSRRQVATLGGAPVERQAEFTKLTSAYVAELDAVAPRISWEGEAAPILRYCAENFSDEEIDAIIAFYTTPAGASLQAHRQGLEDTAHAAVRDFQASVAPPTLEATERLKAQVAAMRPSKSK